MIILQGHVLWLLDPQLAGHAQMHSQPILTSIAEPKYHLFTEGFGIEKPLTAQAPTKFHRIYAPKDTRSPVAQNDLQDFRATPDFP
jgi:hypothetical protein